MYTELIKELESMLSKEFFYLSFKLFTIAVLIILLKSIVSGMASYILFLFDKFLSIGVEIEIYGKRGKIVKYSWFAVVIETEDGYFRVPMRIWRKTGYLVIRNGRHKKHQE